MADCEQNPVIPVYVQNPPLVNENCESCGDPNQGFYESGVNYGKTTELIAGTNITIVDISDSNVDRFIVNAVAAEQLTVALTLTAKAASVVKTNPVLFGTIIDEVQLDWAYNNAIASQNLTNNGGITPPILAPADVQHIYTGQAITDGITFTIAGDDGLGNGSISQAQDSRSITFGNYRVWGVGERYDYDKDNIPNLHPYSALKTFLEDLITSSGTKELSTTRVKTIYGEGGTLEHFYYFYPKSWGYATFTKNNFQGGFLRLKRNASNEIEPATNFSSADAGEQDILISNGLDEEPFMVYMSLNDAIDDPVEPIYVT
jgi:hypothetical protein